MTFKIDNRDKVLSFVKLRGPILPVQITKEINTNILFASAILSELVDKKQLKLSHLKIGSSPLYYYPGQEYKLQQFYKYLHQKEKEAYDLLKNKYVLKDKDQTPVIRVALRQIRDFALPLQVKSNGAVILFWKWYLLDNEKAEPLIKGQLGIKEVVEQHVKQEIKPEPVKTEIRPEPIKEIEQEPVQLRKELKPVKQELKPEPIPKPQKENQQQLKPEKIAKERILPKKEDDFFNLMQSILKEKRIFILDFEIIRKNSEINFIIEISSSVGRLKYLCKAINKKRINEKDLSSAYVQGQLKKLPVLLLTKGELTKKAKTLLDKEFNSIIVRNISSWIDVPKPE